MFAVTVRFTVHRESADEFMQHMRQQASDSLSHEAGCRRFDVCGSDDRPGEVFLYEVYDDEAAFQRHLRSPHFLDFDRTVTPAVVCKSVETWQVEPGERPDRNGRP